MRQPPATGEVLEHSFVIATESDTPNSPVSWEPHVHAFHELTWVRRGAMTLHIGAKIWAVPDRLGMWVPANVVHSGSIPAGVDFQACFFAPSHSPFAPEVPTCVKITPLLHELLLYLGRSDISPDSRARAESMVFDLLEPAPSIIDLTIPEDPRLLVICDKLFANPADQRTLEGWADECAVSSRTLARAFLVSTGQSFTEWRQRLRVQVSLVLLASGWAVADVADEVGYNNASAFISVFRRVTGETPGRFRERAVSDLTY